MPSHTNPRVSLGASIPVASSRFQSVMRHFRHGFAVNALLRWYRAGADVEAKLPLLATYLGHGSAVSTHYYLHFVEPLRTASSERFAMHYGALVSPPAPWPCRRG